ncbi:hypothetical protein K474DRAFT_1714268 [Panus rudis PR-1116 ss-1]|nr:hypothetical protein K474DRAFT_1714268 [Panus rudis PR-1116 ss-1]
MGMIVELDVEANGVNMAKSGLPKDIELTRQQKAARTKAAKKREEEEELQRMIEETSEPRSAKAKAMTAKPWGTKPPPGTRKRQAMSDTEDAPPPKRTQPQGSVSQSQPTMPSYKEKTTPGTTKSRRVLPRDLVDPPEDEDKEDEDVPEDPTPSKAATSKAGASSWGTAAQKPKPRPKTVPKAAPAGGEDVSMVDSNDDQDPKVASSAAQPKTQPKKGSKPKPRPKTGSKLKTIPPKNDDDFPMADGDNEIEVKAAGSNTRTTQPKGSKTRCTQDPLIAKAVKKFIDVEASEGKARKRKGRQDEVKDEEESGSEGETEEKSDTPSASENDDPYGPAFYSKEGKAMWPSQDPRDLGDDTRASSPAVSYGGYPSQEPSPPVNKDAADHHSPSAIDLDDEEDVEEPHLRKSER